MQDGRRSRSPYLFPEFMTGTLFYQSAPSKDAKLNYHTLGEEMILEHRNLKVPINDMEGLDSIHLDDRTFIRREGKFFELLISHPDELVVQHRSSSQLEARTGAYGSKSHTSQIVTMLDEVRQPDFYDLEWKGEYEIVNRMAFWLRQDGAPQKASNLKQIGQIFPEKKKALRKFAAEHKIDFLKPEDVKKLVLFCLEQV